MAVVRLYYSKPVYNPGQKLDGTLGKTIRGWHNFVLTIQTHIKKTELAAATEQTRLCPKGYWLTEHPQVSPTPPKVDMYQISSVGQQFSTHFPSFSIVRVSAEPVFTGA